MPLPIDHVTSALERIAPLHGAAEWDNTGLLLRGTRPVARVGLCIDLTPPVEAELGDCDLIVAYHPPIFRGLKRLDGHSPRQQTLLRLIRAGVHLYSPHTALDAARGGMGDWLIEAVADVELLHDCRPIQPSALDPSSGIGRRAELASPQSLESMLPRIKSWLGLRHLRLAGDRSRLRRSVAVCPGSGGGVFKGLGDVDVLLTGELGHHEVLAHVEGGGAVVLTDHTNCERGYLPQYAVRIGAECPELEIVVSTVDSDPLTVW